MQHQDPIINAISEVLSESPLDKLDIYDAPGRVADFLERGGAGHMT